MYLITGNCFPESFNLSLSAHLSFYCFLSICYRGEQCSRQSAILSSFQVCVSLCGALTGSVPQSSRLLRHTAPATSPASWLTGGWSAWREACPCRPASRWTGSAAPGGNHPEAEERGVKISIVVTAVSVAHKLHTGHTGSILDEQNGGHAVFVGRSSHSISGLTLLPEENHLIWLECIC